MRSQNSELAYSKHRALPMFEGLWRRHGEEAWEREGPHSPDCLKIYSGVLCFIQNGSGDDNDNWRVEVSGGREGDLIQTVKTIFRIVHVNSGCSLHGGTQNLPKW